MTGQPPELIRFSMFFVTSLLVVFVAQSFGLMIGAYFDVVVSKKCSYVSVTGAEKEIYMEE